MIILFDGVCNLCTTSIQFIINRDQKSIFRFTPIQSVSGKNLIKKYSLDIKKNDSIILIQNDSIKYRSTAILLIMMKLKKPWSFFGIFLILPVFFRDFFYKILAKKRYVLFGKKNECMIPNKFIKSRFLN